jgi:hypothetical protein
MWFSSLKKMFDNLVLLFLCFIIILFDKETKSKNKKKQSVPVKELPLYKK